MKPTTPGILIAQKGKGTPKNMKAIADTRTISWSVI